MSINQHGISADMIELARKIMRGEKIEEKKKLDPVGQADADIDNDGDTDASDEYLHKRRKAIKKSMTKEAKDVNADNAEKAVKHDCATHVVHNEHGEGRCIPGMHTLEEAKKECKHCDGTGKHDGEDCEFCKGTGYVMEGYVTHYDVMFQGEESPFIVEDIAVEDLEIVKEMSHGHKKKK